MSQPDDRNLVNALSAMMQPPHGGCSDAQRDRLLRACEVALRTLLTLAENLSKSDNQRHKRLRRSNATLRQRLLDQPGGVRALKAMGFQLDAPDSEFYNWYEDGAVAPNIAVGAIQDALKMCEDKVLKVMRQRMGSKGNDDRPDSASNIDNIKKKKNEKRKTKNVFFFRSLKI